MNYTVISDGEEAFAVMIRRRIYDEGIWKPGELRNLNRDTGMSIYSIDSLKGFDGFTEMYGFRLIYGETGEVKGILDIETNKKVESTDINNLDINNYPEFAFLRRARV